jgi:hypothetical protein
MFTNDFPVANPTFKHVILEVKELLNEIAKFNLIGIRDEACDVYTVAMVAITTYTGIPMPLFWLRSANVWIQRNQWWKNYLNMIGLKFKSEYLNVGSNYHKKEKRRRVVNLAIKDQLMNKTNSLICPFCRGSSYKEVACNTFHKIYKFILEAWICEICHLTFYIEEGDDKWEN